MNPPFAIFKKCHIRDKYNVVECKTEYGIHYEIWKNGEPQYEERHTKFGKRMHTDKWDSYRMASRALQNTHYNNNIVFSMCCLGINNHY